MRSMASQKARLYVSWTCTYAAACCIFGISCANAKEDTNKTAALATDYPSLQAAVDANPGGTIVVPPGDHKISESLEIRADGTVLSGFGHIIQVDSRRSI